MLVFRHDFPKQSVDDLSVLGWVPSGIDSRETPNLTRFELDYLGLNVERAVSVLGIAPRSVIITSQLLANGSCWWITEDVLTLSPSQFKSTIHPWLALCLYINKWGAEHLVNCKDRSCLFGSSYADILCALCQDCETNLVRNGRTPVALRARVFDAIASMSNDEVGALLESSLGHALKGISIDSQQPAVIISATNLIIDSLASPGTENRCFLTETSQEISSQKASIKENYKPGRQDLRKYPLLIAARRWNSWTPNRPTGIRDNSGTQCANQITRDKTGGGYLISDGETTLAVDPGYGYLDMLYDVHGLSVMDLDGVLITHDHPDHSAELQNILSLRHVYKDACNTHLKVLLNPSAYYVHERMLEYSSHLLTDGAPTKIEPGSNLTFNDLVLETTPMFHAEIFHELRDGIREKVTSEVGQSSSLGLNIRGNSPQGHPFHFAIPGDTALPRDDDKLKELAEFYGHPDVAAVHLGSLEEGWAGETACPASEIEYDRAGEKHLGLNGVAKILALMKPRLAIITEFGEELDSKDYRLVIGKTVKKILKAYPVVILPSDIRLFVVVYGEKLLCKCHCGKGYIPVENAECIIEPETNYITYCYPAACASGFEHTKLDV